MKTKTELSKKFLSVVPKIARKLGEKSVDSACIWWYCQPKVPESMKKEKSRGSK